MDFERTLEFVLEQQAKADAELADLRKLAVLPNERIEKIMESMERMTHLLEKIVTAMCTMVDQQTKLAEAQIHTDGRVNVVVDVLQQQQTERLALSDPEPKQ